MEEELNRARMEVEDCRVRVQALMKASASLTSFYQSWLQPKQRVRLRPHYEHIIGLMPKERGHLAVGRGGWAVVAASQNQGRARCRCYLQPLPCFVQKRCR